MVCLVRRFILNKLSKDSIKLYFSNRENKIEKGQRLFCSTVFFRTLFVVARAFFVQKRKIMFDKLQIRPTVCCYISINVSDFIYFTCGKMTLKLRSCWCDHEVIFHVVVTLKKHGEFCVFKDFIKRSCRLTKLAHMLVTSLGTCRLHVARHKFNLPQVYIVWRKSVVSD